MTATGAAALLAAAPSAQAASIWSPVATGTSETINTVDHRAATTIFGTAGGKIFKLTGSPLSGGMVQSFPGTPVLDIAFSPSGSIGMAALAGGKISRSTDGGSTWTPAIQLNTLQPSENTCPFTPVGWVSPLTQDATTVGWASDSTAYITDNLRGSIMRTTTSGATWNEWGRSASGMCKYDAVGVDVAPVVGSDSAYLLDDGANIGFTSNGFASTATRGYLVGEHVLAVDSANSGHLVGGHLNYSDDGGNTFRGLPTVPAFAPVDPTRDVAFVGGTAVWVGDNGEIFTSTDGAVAYAQPADGANASTSWHAVSAASASDVAVGGAGGALVVSQAANTIPVTVTPAPTPTPVPVATPIPTPTPTRAPTPTPTPTPTSAPGTKIVTIPGAELNVAGPATCVKSGASFTATMSMRRLTIKNNRIVKLRRVDFSVDGKRTKIDRKAPFKQTLTVPASKAGTTHTLKAIGYIQVTNGKSPKKSVTVKFQTCS